MKTISSAEFRKVYAKLTEEVGVTSNGHLIGLYVPYSPSTLDQALHPALHTAGERGQCIRHGQVYEWCCDLFEPSKAKPFLAPAM